MTGAEVKELRERWGLSSLQMAELIGYTGNSKNNRKRVRSIERAERVPLYLARLLWMCSIYHDEVGMLPQFPEWPGYDFESVPDDQLPHDAVADEEED